MIQSVACVIEGKKREEKKKEVRQTQSPNIQQQRQEEGVKVASLSQRRLLFLLGRQSFFLVLILLQIFCESFYIKDTKKPAATLPFFFTEAFSIKQDSKQQQLNHQHRRQRSYNDKIMTMKNQILQSTSNTYQSDRSLSCSSSSISWWKKPAILWDNEFEFVSGGNATTSKQSSCIYWDPDLLAQLSSLNKQPQDDNDDDTIEDSRKGTTKNFISYYVLFQLTYHLVQTLHSTIIGSSGRKDKNGDVDDKASIASKAEDEEESIPIAVAIPDGPLLPIAIFLIHILNNPPSSLFETKDTQSHPYYCVLVPLEPNEGKDTLRYMIQDINPRIILACGNGNKDMDRINEQIQTISEISRTSSSPTSSSSTSMLSPQVIDFVTWIQDAIVKMKKNEDASRVHPEKFDPIASSSSSSNTEKEDTLQALFLRYYNYCIRHSIDVADQSSYGNLDSRPTNANTNSRTRISHIVYTSGTTGQPKGCVSSINSLQHYLKVKNQIHRIDEDSVVLLASSLSFDPCLSDILSTLHSKATIAITPKRILLNGGGSGNRSDGTNHYSHVLQRLHITHILCTPTVWTILTSSTYHQLQPQDVPSLQVIALGGEPIPSSIRRIWAAAAPKSEKSKSNPSNGFDEDFDTDATIACRLFATYGVTEACVYQTMGEVFQEEGNESHDTTGTSLIETPYSSSLSPSVGYPFPGLGVRICAETEQSRLVDVVTDGNGVDNSPRRIAIGEVVLYGAQLDSLTSYWKRSDLTKHNFVRDETWEPSDHSTGIVVDVAAGATPTSDLQWPANDRYFYRTGDLGYIHPETRNLHIKGRIQGDSMVKVMGVRVELGEIEASLIDQQEWLQDQGRLSPPPAIVAQCLAKAVSKVPNDKTTNSNGKATTNTNHPNTEIHAFCVLSAQCWKELGSNGGFPHSDNHPGSDDETASGTSWSGILVNSGALLTLLRSRCVAKLKAACVPSAFVLIPELPLSPTGKKDRRRLPLLKDCVSLDYALEQTSNHDQDKRGKGFRSTRQLLPEYGMAGAIVAETIIECLNLQTCQREMLTTNINFSMLGGDSLAATRVTRALYAYHHGVENTRFLGGAFGILDEYFDVTHLLRARSLGEFVDLLDQNGLCQPKGEQSYEEGNNSAPALDQRAHDSKALWEEQSPLEVGAEQFQSNLYEALMQACTNGQSLISMALLDAGADPTYGDHGRRLGKVTGGRMEQKTLFRSSPLHLACAKGDDMLVRKLLQHNAKLNTPDASGLYPLHLVASSLDGEESTPEEDQRRLECVSLLLEAGAPLPMRDGNKLTVLHSAARAGHCRILSHIMTVWREHKGEPIDGMVPENHFFNSRDRWARTPVHWAVLNGRLNALETLLKMGASPSPPTHKVKVRSSLVPETPSELAKRLYGHASEGNGAKILQLLNKWI